MGSLAPSSGAAGLFGTVHLFVMHVEHYLLLYLAQLDLDLCRLQQQL